MASELVLSRSEVPLHNYNMEARLDLPAVGKQKQSESEVGKKIHRALDGTWKDDFSAPQKKMERQVELLDFSANIELPRAKSTISERPSEESVKKALAKMGPKRLEKPANASQVAAQARGDLAFAKPIAKVIESFMALRAQNDVTKVAIITNKPDVPTRVDNSARIGFAKPKKKAKKSVSFFRGAKEEEKINVNFCNRLFGKREIVNKNIGNPVTDYAVVSRLAEEQIHNIKMDRLNQRFRGVARAAGKLVVQAKHSRKTMRAKRIKKNAMPPKGIIEAAQMMERYRRGELALKPLLVEFYGEYIFSTLSGFNV